MTLQAASRPLHEQRARVAHRPHPLHRFCVGQRADTKHALAFRWCRTFHIAHRMPSASTVTGILHSAGSFFSIHTHHPGDINVRLLLNARTITVFRTGPHPQTRALFLPSSWPMPPSSGAETVGTPGGWGPDTLPHAAARPAWQTTGES